MSRAPAVSALALRHRATTVVRGKTELLLEELKEMSPDAMRQTLHELSVHQIELERHNEELCRAQAELDAVRARYFDLYDRAPVGYVIVSESGVILDANLTAATMLGAIQTALVGGPLSRFIVTEDSNVLHLIHKQICETGESQSCELRMQKQDGLTFWTDAKLTATKDVSGATVCRIVLSDITERKQTELYSNLGSEILQILTESGPLPRAIQRVLAVLKARTGFTAVGIRLQDGDDFPYFAQEGFPDDFLRTENSLIAQNANGGICRNEDGSVCLECTCGLVVSGKTGPANLLFTRGGSFWTNNSFSLLDLPATEDPRFHPRNRCIYDGYASVALLPIRNKTSVVGLIQLNDRRKGCFTLQTVESLEGIAAHMGQALMRKQAEDALQRAHDELAELTSELRESEEVLSLFMRYSPIHAFINEATPTESRVLQSSNNFQEMIGISGPDMVGKTMGELFPPEFAAKITADNWAVVNKGEMLELNQDLNGRNYTTIKFPIVQGHKTLLAGYVIDITASKQAEVEKEKLAVLNRQLEKTESLGRMAGAIAHHFNNQLQAVMLNLEMATINPPRTVGPVEGLSAAMLSARKAAEVSTLMLTYLGHGQGKHEPLDLAEVCLRSLPLLRAAMPQSVALESDLPSPGPGVSADSDQLQQILTNLVTNAWEASDRGRGPIRLSVKTVAAADISRSAGSRFPIDWQPQASASAYAFLEVADSGCGIAAKEIEKLFDPFFTTKFTGRGLGLSVVLGIARSHGGFVTVESESGRGSTFRVFFPVSAEAVPRKPAQASVGPISKNIRPSATVLVVEDEPVVRTTLARVLESSGFTVLEAEDGVVAVEIFCQHRDEIGCVLCDLTMPRMNGWETLTALRQLMPGIGVILASGYSEAQAMEGDHPERPQVFLHKPYEVKALLNAIHQILPHRNA